MHAVDILRHRPESEGDLRCTDEMIERHGAHLTRLVSDLLDVSAITRGKLEIRPEPAALAEIVRWAAEGIQAQIGPKPLQLEVALPTEPIPIYVDSVRLTQVVLNLLDNSCKFTPAG